MLNETAIVEAIMGSPKYAVASPETVRAAVKWAAIRHKKAADIEKYARKRLHGTISAFSTLHVRDGEQHLSAHMSGDRDALKALLYQHASMRERMAHEEAICRAIIEFGGENSTYFDMACGLFPIALGARGARVIGWDAHKAVVDCVNLWGTSCELHIEAFWQDALTAAVFPTSHCTLIMKFMPLIEAQEHGGGARVLDAIDSQKCVVSFPTRALGGRKVGMYRHYEEWMDENLPTKWHAAEKFSMGSEAFWLLERV